MGNGRTADERDAAGATLLKIWGTRMGFTILISIGRRAYMATSVREGMVLQNRMSSHTKYLSQGSGRIGVGDPNYGTRIEAGHISRYAERRIWAGLDGIGWMDGKMDIALDR